MAPVSASVRATSRWSSSVTPTTTCGPVPSASPRSGVGAAADRRRRLSRGRRVAASEARREREAAEAAEHEHEHEHDDDVPAEDGAADEVTTDAVADESDATDETEAVAETEVADGDEPDEESGDGGSEDPSKGAN